jgi:hypothetical protein
MTAHTEVRNFDTNINLYDTTDPVLGGAAGQSNDPIKALANRSRFLYDFHAGFVDVAAVSASSTINNTFLRKLIYINATDNVVLALDAASNFTIGQSLHFKCKNIFGKCTSITPGGSDIITDGTLAKSIWLYDGEEISITKVAAAEWQIISVKGNFDMVGNDGLVRRQPRNSLIAQGQTVSRFDYARLFNTMQADIISESSWLGDPYNYRGFFAAGDGATTFRLPDMRSMSWRALDLARGTTYSRIGATAGAYQKDELLTHNHAEKVYQAVNNGGTRPVGFSGTTGPLVDSGEKTGDTGGTETVTKNIGLTPIIYF